MLDNLFGKDIEKTNDNCAFTIDTTIKLQIENEKIEYQGMIVGLKHNIYLIVKISDNEMKQTLSKNDPLLAEFFYKGVIYTFTSSVMQIITAPEELIFIDYPNVIEERNIRNYKRVECVLPVEVGYKAELFEGIIVNLSIGGCSLILKNTDIAISSMIKHTTVDYRLHDGMQLYLRLPGIQREIIMNCLIRNVVKNAQETYIGLEIAAYSKDGKRQLSDYIMFEERIEQSVYFQTVINSILKISMEQISLKEQLDKILFLIATTPRLSIQSKCSIYIVEDDPNTLVIGSQRGYSKEILETCSTVPFGRCLCGKAASKREIVFSDSIDHHHTIKYEGMQAHGHYCIPIISHGRSIGVINIYIKDGEERNRHIEDFLSSIAFTLAGMIERKQSEEKQAYLLKELQASQEQTLQSSKMAALGQLAAGIAHEINNPVGFINQNIKNLGKFSEKLTTLIDLYDKAEKSNKQKAEFASYKREINYEYIKTRTKDMVERSCAGIDRIKKIILDLKTYSNLDASEVGDLDINKSLDVILELLHHEIKNKISVLKEYNVLPLVTCYAGKLNQVFMNVLINATQAIEREGTITIRTGREEEYVKVDICDTGTGVPNVIKEKIFDPFFTTKPVGQGAGLGLSVSYSIIKQHEGEISFQSNEGAGSTFTIKIPLIPHCLLSN